MKNYIELCGMKFINCRDLEWERNDDDTIRLSFTTDFVGEPGFDGTYRIMFHRLDVSDVFALRSTHTGALWEARRIDVY